MEDRHVSRELGWNQAKYRCTLFAGETLTNRWLVAPGEIKKKSFIKEESLRLVMKTKKNFNV